jgi:hypothetical protein
MLGGEAVNDARVPVIHHGSEMDEEDHRCAGVVPAELSICELDSTGSDRARGHILPTNVMVLQSTHVRSSRDEATAHWLAQKAVAFSSIDRLSMARVRGS